PRGSLQYVTARGPSWPPQKAATPAAISCANRFAPRLLKWCCPACDARKSWPRSPTNCAAWQKGRSKGNEVMGLTPSLLVGLSALLFAARVLPIRRFWLLPLRNGENHFLAAAVEPGFYSGAGARLLRRYRIVLIVPLLIDAIILIALIASGKFAYIVGEQLLSFILTTIFFNLVVVNFSVKARFLSPASADGAEQPVKSVQLSLEPRRLRDHTNFWIEAIIGASLLACLLIAIRSGPLGTWSHPSLDE